MCFKNSNNFNILIFPLGLLRKIRFNTHQPYDLYKYLINFNTGAFAHLRATRDMRTGKSCMESQWEKIWFLSYKAIKGMHLKLHILIFHITYTGCCRKWVGWFWTMHMLVDRNKSRWGAWVMCPGTVWSSVCMLKMEESLPFWTLTVTTHASRIIPLSHLQDLPSGKVTGIWLRLMAVICFTALEIQSFLSRGELLPVLPHCISLERGL